jgi:periplasmic divalent cation tolerance protein
MEEYVQIVTSTRTKKNAEKIADTLVQNRLAACVQIVGPIASVYQWKEKIERTTEWLCVVKTRRDFYKEVEASILQNHTYEVPEVLAVLVVDSYESYLTWLDRELRR